MIACGAHGTASPAAAAAAAAAARVGWTPALIDSLTRFGAGREQRSGTAGAVSRDTASVIQAIRTDSVRSRWLRRVVAERGWPTQSVAGDSAARVAWLILQHTPLYEWQSEMLPVVERLAARGELPRANLALFADRVLVRRGEPQRYGSHFDVVGGRLVPAPIADPERLDERRAAVGLPPMSEYVRTIREQYRLPVVWPPEK